MAVVFNVVKEAVTGGVLAMMARGGRGVRGGEKFRVSDDGPPSKGIEWVEDKFYEPEYYNFLCGVEVKTP